VATELPRCGTWSRAAPASSPNKIRNSLPLALTFNRRIFLKPPGFLRGQTDQSKRRPPDTVFVRAIPPDHVMARDRRSSTQSPDPPAEDSYTRTSTCAARNSILHSVVGLNGLGEFWDRRNARVPPFCLVHAHDCRVTCWECDFPETLMFFSLRNSAVRPNVSRCTSMARKLYGPDPFRQVPQRKLYDID